MGLRHGPVTAHGALVAFALTFATLSGSAWAQTPPAQQIEQAGMYHFFAEAFVGSGVGHAGLGPTVGGRVGYAAGREVRGTISAVVSYHFGNADSVAGATPLDAYELVPRRLYTGVELGVQPSWRMLRVRPYLTFGRLARTVDCDGSQCARVPSSVLALDTVFAFGPGIDVIATIGIVSFGIDARWLAGFAQGAFLAPTSDTLAVAAVIGVSLP